MRGRVLVVDDDSSVLYLLRQVLQRAGYAVRVAATLKDAVALFQLEPCDLAIVDKNMPGVTGFEVIARLRELYPDLPVIMVTAYPEPVLIPGIKIQGYLAKPFERIAIVPEHVEKVLALSRKMIELGLARPPHLEPAPEPALKVVS